MSDEALRSLIAYRLEQANEALEEARLMQDAGHFRATVNRAYYAMFYATQALLAKRGLRSSKHSGAISTFDREFVKTKLFERDFSRWLHRLFALRCDADYGDGVQVPDRKAEEALEQARLFVARVESFLEHQETD